MQELLFGREPQDVLVTSSKASINSLLDHYKEGELYFNPEYQREYVWGEVQQQLLLDSLLYTGVPIPGISVVLNNNGDPSQYFEVVDGRQRVTTLLKFFLGEIPYKVSGQKPIYFHEFDKAVQRSILRLPITQSELTTRHGKDVTLKQKMEYFRRINFGGTLQSEEHKAMLDQKIAALD